ncbi:MAG: anaerobic ribonucleoside-triphosphate reductase [Anaerovoracaceae bacterium]
MSAKRLFPNFSFLDAPFNKQYYEGDPNTECAYMQDESIGNTYDPTRKCYRKREPRFTSVNLPRLAIKARRSGYVL